MVTIKDIARESGYSISTVSRVINNRNDVSPEARSKIEETVEKFRFVPNSNAKHLKQSNSKAVGVIVKGTSNALFAAILEEIQRIVEKTAYTAVVSYLDEEEDEVEHAALICREQKPLGLLFLGGNPGSFEKGFGSVDVPAVLVTSRADGMNFSHLSSVSTDDAKAARCAVDALFEAGHRNIGVIGGDIDKSYTSRLRYQGCIDSFLSHGRKWDETLFFEKSRFSYESAGRAVKSLIGKYREMTAVFAMSDVMAVGAVRALFDLGYRVPEDISVVGFDGTSLAEYYHPRLATVRQQYRILAEKSVEILISRIEMNGEPVHETIPFTFLKGESIRNLKEKSQERLKQEELTL